MEIMSESDIIYKLITEIPEYLLHFDLNDDNLYVVIGNLGLFIEKLHDSIFEIEKTGTGLIFINNHESIIFRVFQFLNSIYDSKVENIKNIIDVSIWELLILLKNGKIISKKYMSDSMYIDYVNTYRLDF